MVLIHLFSDYHNMLSFFPQTFSVWKLPLTVWFLVLEMRNIEHFFFCTSLKGFVGGDLTVLGISMRFIYCI